MSDIAPTCEPTSISEPFQEENQRERWGRRTLGLGLIISFPSLCVSIALLHAGMVTAYVGSLLLWPKIHRLPGFWFGIAFAIWLILGMAINQQTSFKSTNYGWLAIYISSIGLQSLAIRRWALMLTLGTSTASVALAAVQFTVGHGGPKPFRISSEAKAFTSSSGFMPLHLTQSFILVQVLLMALINRTLTGLTRWQIIALRIISILGILLANARTGLLALVGALTSYCAAPGGRRLAWASLVLVGAVGAVVTWSLIISPNKINRALAGQDGRLIHWPIAKDIALENPWFGVGEGRPFIAVYDQHLMARYPDGSQDHWKSAPDAHNIVLGLASERGIPALLFFILMITSILRHLYLQRMENPTGWAIGCATVASMAIGGQFEHYVGHTQTSHAFYLLLGLALALGRPASNGQRTASPAMSGTASS